MSHIGRHHYESCGEYRPIDPRVDCPECGPVCPGCGAKYAKPKSVRRCPHCQTIAPDHVTDAQYNAHIERCKEGT